jgi:NAD(P)-dependent dehydrogenase (short-subunit alcohol dehydrogenase family)
MNSSQRRVAVITGATGGIGRWIALGLARAGYHVVMIGRDAHRGSAVSDWIAEQVPDSSIELRLADLSLLRSTHRVGLEIAADHPRLDLLINNAGMFTAHRQVTLEGREKVLAVNHLAPYVLTDVLEEALRAGAPSRIINVGSSSSDHARIRPDDLELVGHWGFVRSYSQSKLAVMMSTFARAQRLRGSGVVANVVHPGAVASGLIREKGAIGIAWRMMAPFLRTEEQGAATPLHAALAPDWATVTATYVKDRAAARPNPLARDAALIERVEATTRALVAASLLEGSAAA